jgi:alkanesulfonate monooxygenase SsuD/methylene tetrahydromethanopterin reductase-like flavin-dependent oxidoreductase (luciferase family)/putative sterol carrier protein
MRFGIFYEHQLPRPWGADSEHRLLRDALAQIEIADRVGFDFVWEVEHHFLEEYSHSSASDVFLAAASQRTKRIRLGLGILPLPPGYQHPARVAETVATLDLVSDGRVEFGTGETSSGAELEGFGVDRATKRAQWDEAVRIVTRMLVEEPFAGIEGRFVSMPQRNVVPKPLQKPHPPLWVACSRRETIRLAAEKGIGALSFSFVEPEEAAEWVAEYRAIIASERCVPAGFAVNPRVAVVLPMMCHPDEAEAIERGIDGAHFFGYSLAHYYVFGDHRPGRTNIYEEFLQRRDDVGFARSVIRAEDAPLGVRVLQQGLGSLRGAIGTPDQIRDLCRRYAAAGVDQVIFVLQAGRNRHEHICESLEIFGAEVLPQFAAEADAVERARDAELAGAVEAALRRRQRPRTAPTGYTIGPTASGPPAAERHRDGHRSLRRPRVAALRRAAEDRGEQAFRAFVRRAGDDRLEATAGSDRGLKLIFGAMAHAYEPDKARGFAGELHYELTRRDGRLVAWTVRVGPTEATVHPGAAAAPALTLKMTVADFLRMAAGDLDAGKALLTGRLDLVGDFSLAQRLGEMFGQPAAL